MWFCYYTNGAFPSGRVTFLWSLPSGRTSLRRFRWPGKLFIISRVSPTIRDKRISVEIIWSPGSCILLRVVDLSSSTYCLADWLWKINGTPLQAKVCFVVFKQHSEKVLFLLAYVLVSASFVDPPWERFLRHLGWLFLCNDLNFFSVCSLSLHPVFCSLHLLLFPWLQD